MSSQEKLITLDDADGGGVIVFDPSRLPQADGALFDPAAPQRCARPVDAGGRGAAWFIETGAGPAVLRHYRRGGLVARVSRDSYLWRGAARTRSFAEFRLMARLHAAGLPVPAPLAARYQRRGALYRADIVIERIAGARSLAQRLPTGGALPPWQQVGAAIARLHRAGVEHADLNAHNILLDDRDTVWLIDFDRSRQRPRPGRWQEANLRRLQRSLRKLAPGSAGVEVGFAGIREGYLAQSVAP